jgi:hypothetical protein
MIENQVPSEGKTMEFSYLLALIILVEAIVVFGAVAFWASRREGEVAGACFDCLGSFNLDAGRMIKCSAGCKY